MRPIACESEAMIEMAPMSWRISSAAMVLPLSTQKAAHFRALEHHARGNKQPVHLRSKQQENQVLRVCGQMYEMAHIA